MSKAKIETAKKPLPVIPWRSTSQPGFDPNATRYGSKAVPTMIVKVKGTDREITINSADFDPAKHEEMG